MPGLKLDGAPLSVLCLGAHADDIEIGAGGALLTLIERRAIGAVRWCVASGAGERRLEADQSAQAFLAGVDTVSVEIGTAPDGRFPLAYGALRAWLEAQRAAFQPDLILTHRRDDAHQDHRALAELTWSIFRGPLILEYEIPKWDGDLSQVNTYVPLSPATLDRKIALLHAHFGSQRGKDWFDAATFEGLARLRGVECRSRFAEGFVARKLVLG